ncbi:MAG: MopE-related protein [Proteobacteria bacterium]|nr:MopE-related protein [Pseudomonadota bacterium]
MRRPSTPATPAPACPPASRSATTRTTTATAQSTTSPTSTPRAARSSRPQATCRTGCAVWPPARSPPAAPATPTSTARRATAASAECVGAVGTVGGQPEICNGRDDDCNGMFDEGLSNLGSCGGPNVGACHTGTLACQGGGTICLNDQGPNFEACDNIDNDCDGSTDEDYNKLTDPRNCMTCGHVCSAMNAVSGCAGGACTIASCAAGYHNLNGTVSDGCEYGPCQIDGAEVCDGVDNNCDGMIDNGLTAPAGICQTAGACTGATATCMGAAGWKCNYGPTVSTDASGNIIAETKCDTIDNDCDTKIDENQPNKGLACADAGIGVCKGTGTFICDPANLDGPATCNITTPGGTMSAEKCDGLDNDCNGVVDNGANTGNLIGQEWVTLPSPSTVQIMKYEASRPDATALLQGTTSAFSCSKQNVVPWTNVTYQQAVAACTSIGARLCTETEWENMCTQPETYAVSVLPGAFDHLIIQAEDAQTVTPGTSGGTARSWVADSQAGFTGGGAMIATPDTGAQVTAANALTQSPRMDFTVDFGATAQTYYVWVRIYAASSASDELWVSINTTAPGTIGTTALSQNSDGNWRWMRSDAFAAVSGTKVVSLYMREDGLRVDSLSISRDGVNPPGGSTSSAAVNTVFAYQSNRRIPQDQVCNDNPFDADLPPATPGDQDDVLPTGSLPMCFANGAGTNDAFDMSGNVKEWTKARAAGQNPIRGGASNTEVGGLACDLDFTLGDDGFFFPNVGFRCCR